MVTHNAYTRRISSEEARESYVMVLKDRLCFFPPVGEEFKLRDGGRLTTVRVEADPCTCRGPEKPHDHYRIRCAGLFPRQEVRFERQGERSYSLARTLRPCGD